MQELDFKQLDDKQFKLVEDFLIRIKENGFTRDDFNLGRWQMDCAIKQEFLEASYAGNNYGTYGLNTELVQETLGLNQEDSNDWKPDVYSDLFHPLMVKFYRAYLVNMSNLCFPANGDWLNITRSFSEWFYKTGVERFVPFVNDAWVDIIKTENQRFSLKDKYKTAMSEVIRYGNTFLAHQYNPQLHYMEPSAPGIGTAAMYPITNEWRKSNLVYYYDVNYNELLDRKDLDQEVIEQIQPQLVHQETDALLGYGQERSHEFMETRVPFGQVRLYDFFIPSLYATGANGEVFLAKNVYLTTFVAPTRKPDSDLPQQQVYILKATQDVNPVEHGLLFAMFATAAAGTFYQQGPLQPFLPHQYTANQFLSEISRTVGMTTDPPKNVEPTGAGMLDPMETPLPDFESGAAYVNMKVTPLIDPTSSANSLNVYLAFMNYFERVFEEGVGLTKGQQGIMNQGRKTATEIKESYSGGQLNLVEAAARFDEQILRPSVVCRVAATQLILQEQVKKGVVELLGVDAGVDETGAYEQVLLQNPLFMRLLNYSAIEANYREYYKKTMGEWLDDQAIMQEVEQMVMQIQQMLQFADSPVPPPPNVPQIRHPETGNPMPTTEEIGQLQAMYYQEEQMKRDQTRQQAKGLEMEIKRKELLFKDVKEPPEPSYKLFYEMLIAPITDSDIIVTGSMTSISKSLMSENLMMLVQALPALGATTQEKVDYDWIAASLARASDINPRDFFKDEADIMRDRRAAAEQAQFMQQLQIQAAQGKPGSQPPQFG